MKYSWDIEREHFFQLNLNISFERRNNTIKTNFILINRFKSPDMDEQASGMNLMKNSNEQLINFEVVD